MRFLLSFLLLIPLNTFAQEIKWTTVPFDNISPKELLSTGIIELDNGDRTPEADLYINFELQKIFYRNLVLVVISALNKDIFY